MKTKRLVLAALVAMPGLVAVPAVSADEAACQADSDAGLRRQAEQKLVLLDRLAGDSAPVQRVLDSGLSGAIAAIEDTRKAATQARLELNAGCNVSAAETAARGLRQASDAFRLVRSEEAVGEQEYRALHRRTTAYLQTLQSQPQEVRGVGAADLVGMQRQLSRAETLAIDGKYSEAGELLKPIADRLVRRLFAIFDQQTIYYEREFASPEDEYAYFVEQYQGYQLLLVQIAIERQPPYSSRERFETALHDAGTLSEEAEQLAAGGDWQSSLTAIRQALEKCEQALRLVGVSY